MMATTLKSYAGTTVSPARSRQHIQDLLERVGAKGFRWTQGVGFPGREQLDVGLEWEGRDLAFRLMITFEDEGEQKQKMRALYWFLKTKVEAVQMGLVDMQQEFLPHLLTGSGDKARTVWQELGENNMKLLPPSQENA
jgi:hypothetical protein